MAPGTQLVMGYFLWYTCMSFTMKALADAALGLHWCNIMVMLHEFMLLLHYGCDMVALWLCCGCCYSCISQEKGCVSQERINVSVVPMAPWVSFQPLSSCLAYPGFSKQCAQQYSWHCKHESALQSSLNGGEMLMIPAQDTPTFFLLSSNNLRTLVVEIGVEILVEVLGPRVGRWGN